MILLCLRKSPIFKSGTNVIQQNAHALCLYSFLDCIFIVAWDCCLFVPWVFGDTSKTDKKLTVPTLEPKCRRYYSDNQMYNDGNLMN